MKTNRSLLLAALALLPGAAAFAFETQRGAPQSPQAVAAAARGRGEFPQ